MNQGLMTGIAVSVVVHSGVLLLFNRKPEVEPEAAPPPPTLEVVELPLPDMEEEEEAEFDQAGGPPSAEPQMTYAPPMLADVPSLVTVDSFIQPLQPPPPETPKPGAIVIPVSRFKATGAEVTELFNLKDLDRPPREIVRVRPVLPPTLLSREDARPGGTVVVEFTVDAEGRVRDPFVVSSTREDYDEAVIEAVRNWRFLAGRKDGRNVSTRVSVSVEIKPPNRRQ